MLYCHFWCLRRIEGDRTKIKREVENGEIHSRRRGRTKYCFIAAILDEKAGFDVRVARDGDEALAAVEDRAPDLILLDVMIPKRDGYDVCQTIRANPDWKNIFIIMLTAKGREVDREKGLALGANDYVTKPFSTRDLTEKVKQILNSAV